jgi:maltoporin
VQSIPLPTPGTIGTQDVTVLDRQRAVAALTADHKLSLGGLVLRPRLHGELHRLPAGTRLVEHGTLEQSLPADSGTMTGMQLSLWGWAPDSYAHLFLRRATGLAATGLLDVPLQGFAPDLTVRDATQDVLALASNHESDRLSLAAGLVARRWTDADERLDGDDGWDLSWALRPALKLGAHGNLGLELAQEQSWRDGLDPRTGAQELATIERLSVLPALQLKQGTFGRPQVRLQYTLSRLNEAARARFDPADARSQRPVSHWVGVGAEWWIDSRSYR